MGTSAPAGDTTTIRLAVATMPSLARAPRLSATDAVDEVALRMEAKPPHRKSRPSSQMCPSSIRMTMMIKMVPMMPTPP
jgi:hypothetical protein